MNRQVINWGIFIVLCFIWGSSFILMKLSQEGLTSPQIASLRIFAGALIFLPFVFIHLKKIPRSKLWFVTFAGLFGNLLPAFCFAEAITRIDSSLAGILNSLTPICVVAIAIIVFKDNISPQKIIGVLIGFAGLCLLTFTQKKISDENLVYSLLVIAGTISYGINVNLVSHRLKEINPLYLGTVSLGFMSIPAGIILWQQGFFDLDLSDTVARNAVLYSILLGIGASSIATVIFYVLVQRAGGLFASLVTYGIPFVAIFWGVLDGESVTFIEMISLGIILAGVYLANRTVKKNV